MKRQIALIFVLAAGLTLSGCGAIKKFTKKNDNTVLPGEREEILTPDQYKVEDATVTGGPGAEQAAPDQNAPCNPDVDANCEPGVDQEASGTGQ